MDQPDVPPWERPGSLRRDSAPHRGYELTFLANVALILSVLSFFTCLPALLAIVLSKFVVFVAERDLGRITAGTMDRRGRAETEEARRMGMLAMRLGVLAMIGFWAVAYTLYVLTNISFR